MARSSSSSRSAPGSASSSRGSSSSSWETSGDRRLLGGASCLDPGAARRGPLTSRDTAQGYVQNTLIVGAGDVGQLVGRKLRQHPELGIRLVGFVDADPKSMRADLDGVPVLGTPDDIATLVREHDVQRVVVSFSNDRHEHQLGLVHGLRDLDVQVDLVPRLFEAVGPVVAIHDVEGLKLLTLPPMRASRAAPRRRSGSATSSARRCCSRCSRP